MGADRRGQGQAYRGLLCVSIYFVFIEIYLKMSQNTFFVVVAIVVVVGKGQRPKMAYREVLNSICKEVEKYECNADFHFEDIQYDMAPKTTKQVENVNYGVDSEKKISIDYLLSLVELSNCDLKGFILKIDLEPDMAVIMVHSAMLNIAQTYC